VQAFINGDELGAALNAAGVFSGLGDAVKVSGAVGTFVVKYPGKISDVGKVLAKYVLKYVPSDLVKIKTLNKLSDNVASTLIKDDIDADDLLKIIENNGNLGKTLGVVKMSDGSVRWLEEGLTVAEAKALGRSPSGWNHILEKHKEHFMDAFGVSIESDMETLIYRSVKKGSLQVIPIEKGGGTIYVYYVTIDKPMTTIVSSNGYIVTSHPGLS